MLMIYEGLYFDADIKIEFPQSTDSDAEKTTTSVTEKATDSDADRIFDKGQPELTTESSEVSDTTNEGGSKIGLIFGVASAILLIIAICLVYMLNKAKQRLSEMEAKVNNTTDEGGAQMSAEGMTPDKNEKSSEDKIGKLHNIGRRKGQQDSLGLTSYNGGVLAVVADGMGGLADGDKVSQRIVMTMLQDAALLKAGSPNNQLYEMIAHANREVNQMLGPEGLYKSGSTLLAVAAEKNSFHWAAVGDSHIYLYRANQLLLLNREHVYEGELIQKAINGETTFKDVVTNPKKGGLTSFIGMGELKYIDGSIDRLTSRDGDWILLMSDGVFNTVPEADICRILNESYSAKAAAERLEQEVLARQNPKQDNFTAIILEL